MKQMPTDDDCFGPGSIREDGRKLHPAYLFQVKAPAESNGPWDCYKLLATTPADQAFRPLGGRELPIRPDVSALQGLRTNVAIIPLNS